MDADGESFEARHCHGGGYGGVRPRAMDLLKMGSVGFEREKAGLLFR